MIIVFCRLTRSPKKLFTVLQYGYAVIDLEILDPLNMDDLCLSHYLAYILQVCIKFDTFHPLSVVRAFEKTLQLFSFILAVCFTEAQATSW